MQKEQEMGGWSKRTANRNKDTPTQKKTRDARQDMLHVSSRAVSKQPYIIEIMNQREQARWRTAGGWFAAGFLRTACARSLWVRPRVAFGNKVQQSATNQIIVHGRCPHKRSWENARRFDSISQTSTATQCGQLPASGDATRTASNISYILNRAGGLSLVATGNRRGVPYGATLRICAKVSVTVLSIAPWHWLFAATWAPTMPPL